jgi:hypothetical protein
MISLALQAPPRHRAYGALVAVTMTVLPLAALWLQPLSLRSGSAVERVLQVFYLDDSPTVRNPAVAPKPPTPRSERTRGATSFQAALPTPAPSETRTTAGAATELAQAAVVAPVASVASASSNPSALKLDGTVLRAAQQAAKSDVRKMAEASGAALDDPASPPSQRLGDAVAQSTKPECLGAGGSLLQVFVIAYWVAKDKCRVR